MQTIYATCNRHGDLTRDKVNKGGIMRSGEQQYRCKICSRKDQVKHYNKHKTSLKYYHQKNKGK